MSWYSIIHGGGLMQGDIIKQCPVPLVDIPAWPLPDDFEADVDIFTYDLVILSQSCDLENEKIEEVILAQIIDWEAYRSEAIRQGKEHVKSTNFRRALVAGNVPNLSILHKHEDPPTMNWSIVDFHRIFVLPKSLVSAVIAASGPRLRLEPPYREHLAQAFARYFMRVGLPHDAKDFIQEGKIT